MITAISRLPRRLAEGHPEPLSLKDFVSLKKQVEEKERRQER
jgi:hypothetical protein